MDAIEYLLNHLAEEYKFFPDTKVVLTTKDMTCPHILGGKKYCVGFFDIDKQYYKFIKDYNIDGCIFKGLPNSLSIKAKYPTVYNIANWIQERIFNFMLSHTEIQQSKTELVRLRIATNMIYGLTYLDSDSKLLWSNWIKELYWERKKVLHQWYLENILPF